jgi:RimJ/RimL family protein N-acetyltransferase
VSVDFTGFQGETDRLLIRPYTTTDLAAHLDLHSRPDVVRFIPWGVQDEAGSRAAIERSQKLVWEGDDDSVKLAGFEKETRRLVGDFVIMLRSVEHGNGEVGYVVHPDFQGRGFATEAAGAMLQLAFDELGMRRMIARLDPRNVASARVLERLGMRREAHLVKNEWFKGELADEYDYALLAEEWESSPTRSLISWKTVAPAPESNRASVSPPA